MEKPNHPTTKTELLAMLDFYITDGGLESCCLDNPEDRAKVVEVLGGMLARDLDIPG